MTKNLFRSRLKKLKNKKMKIFAFAGSTSSSSRNRELVKFVLKSFKDDEVNFIDLNDYEMPIFSVDREKKGFPEAAKKFLKDIADCDAIICSLAEHNRIYTAAFKNIYDWASRIEVKVWQGKPMFLMTTSTGGYGGGNVMEHAKMHFPGFGAEIKETFSLPKFEDNFDVEKGEVSNVDFAEELKEKIQNFKKSIE